MTDAGIHSVKTKRTPNKHRTGKRKPHEGLMLQTDASPFDWLNTGEMFSLHGAIDDATSNVTVDEANEFLQSYIKDFNAQFAVPAEESIPYYRQPTATMNLGNILCVVEKRVFDNGGVFSMHNRSYQIVPMRRDLLPATGKAEILVSPRFGVRASYFGVVYEVIPFIKPQKTVSPPAEKKKVKYIPPDS